MTPTRAEARRPYDLVDMALVQLATGMAFCIFNAFLLDLAGIRMNAWVVLVAALVELAAFDWFWVRGRMVLTQAPPVDALAFAAIVALVTITGELHLSNRIAAA